MQNLKSVNIPLVSTDKDMVHKMMAARARVLTEPGVDTLRIWANASTPITTNTNAVRAAAVHYAAVLSHMKLNDFARARVSMGKLNTAVAGYSTAMYQANLLEMELALAAGDKMTMQKMVALLRASSPATSSTPSKNRAELFLISNAQIVNNEADKAAPALRAWVGTHPQDALAWQLLSKAYSAQKQTIRAIRADAEGQVAMLDYAAALDRFRAAQEMVKTFASAQDRDFIEESIVDVRTRQVQELLKLQLKDEKDLTR